ncbi:RNA polymerase sigma factor [Candidatus Solirubrobacter pratensis]|uniref:RNA polymerase sigma factor n=1 Tax=Candidatus Solirubrobacter pratensis TaxID=1298857 RepID=UPI000424A368|nr:sigma factor-like helix-turn-helix DNA-binding protein [Candidatus Solirubrobacter pratensis]
MPPRAVNAFERLAPDQRAAVELVLRGRSYAELAGLLGIPEDTVRSRARGALEALAPDLPPPARAGEIADWLLGQGGDGAALLADRAARRWAETVAAPLRELPGAPVPALPEVSSPALTAPLAPAAPPPDVPASPTPAGASRRGGAILIAAAIVVVGVVLAFILTRGGDDGTSAAGTPVPSATAVATGTPQAAAGDIVLRGPAGSKAVGLMRLFRANDNTVRFALAAQDVAPNTGNATYSIWFEKKDGSALRLGVAQSPVGKDKTLTTAGPRNADVKKFPEWFASYDSVLVTQDSSPGAKKPGKVILSGNLPHASG